MNRLIDADALWRDITTAFDDCEDILEIIDRQPTIEPVQRWIPCSKRLPKKSGKYYVSGGGKAWICEYLIVPNFIGGWRNDASNPVVQEWMPLPKPWKGEENE